MREQIWVQADVARRKERSGRSSRISNERGVTRRVCSWKSSGRQKENATEIEKVNTKKENTRPWRGGGDEPEQFGGEMCHGDRRQSRSQRRLTGGVTAEESAHPGVHADTCGGVNGASAEGLPRRSD